MTKVNNDGSVTKTAQESHDPVFTLIDENGNPTKSEGAPHHKSLTDSKAINNMTSLPEKKEGSSEQTFTDAVVQENLEQNKTNANNKTASLYEHYNDDDDGPDIATALANEGSHDHKVLNPDNSPIAPFFEFSASTWSTFAHNKRKVNLTEEELQRCLAFNEKISLEEVSNIYLPLSRLLYMYVRSRHDRATVIQQFLGKSIEIAPFIISISGSVACGKTTTANLLKHLISSWDTNPKVELITTDGFLYPNKILHERHIEAKKGYPISYDVKALMTFLHKLKNGEPNLKVPKYSHLYYDVIPNEYTIVDRPDILILEGVNVLQNGADYPTIRNKVFISDFIDFSIYVDAEEDSLVKWYLDRFLKLRESTFSNPNSYFHRYAKMPLEDAVTIANTIWSAVNHDNLVENIIPSRNRANLILHKGPNHCIDRVYLRK